MSDAATTSDHPAPPAPTRSGGERLALIIAITVTTVHLLGHVLRVSGVTSGGALTGPTQWVVMLTLAGWLLWSARPASPRGASPSRGSQSRGSLSVAGARLLRWTLIALVFSWVGDTLPALLEGDAAFIAMVGGFLLAQNAYVVAFAPYLARAMRATRPTEDDSAKSGPVEGGPVEGGPVEGVPGPSALVLIAMGYAVVVVFLAALLYPHAGILFAPVVVYGLCLGAMGVAAWGLGTMAGIAGMIFFVSDALIAVGTFLPALFDAWPTGMRSLVVMATYLTAQWLLVSVVRRRVRAAEAVG